MDLCDSNPRRLSKLQKSTSSEAAESSIIHANDIAFKTIKEPSQKKSNDHRPDFPDINRFPVKQYLATNETIEQSLVHKHDINNVVITCPTALSAEEKIYRSKLVIPYSNPFFFDHPYDHVPGMLVVEAFRQIGTALSHQFFNAPKKSTFILHKIETEFYNYTSLENDVFLDVKVTVLKEKKGVARKLRASGIAHQNNQAVCDMISSWSVIPQKIMTYLKKSEAQISSATEMPH